MAQAKIGDTVQVHYTGKLEDGTVFESSEEHSPLQFRLGEGQVIPGFEKAIMGMEQGTQKTAHITPNDAYGPHRKDQLMALNRQQLPPDITPTVGQRLQVQHGDGRTTAVTVAKVSPNQVILDANHPLAGRDLFFDIQLVAIV